VLATFRPRRNSVVPSNTVGNEVNSTALRTTSVVRNRMMDSPIDTTSSASITNDGSGASRMTSTPNTASAINSSDSFNSIARRSRTDPPAPRSVAARRP
jgi:hypothetical protein